MTAPPSLEALRANRREIERIAAQHRASNVRVFGSVVRGEATERSDLDVLVDFAPGTSLFDLIDLKLALEDLLGTSVDVVSADGIDPYVRGYVMAEAVPL